jgi:hypothetical protein
MTMKAAMRCAVFMAGSLATPGPSVAAFGDDASRVSILEAEIRQLHRDLAEQDRRIRRLEDELANAGVSAGAGTARRAPGAARPVADAPSNVRLPWHAAAAWERIATGMTSAEVAGILGEPTSADSVDALKTMFYRGTTPDGVALSGIVNLRDDRVVAVKKPAFRQELPR